MGKIEGMEEVKEMEEVEEMGKLKMEEVKEMGEVEGSKKYSIVGKKPIKVVEHYGSEDFEKLLEIFFKYIFEEEELWDLKKK